MNGNEFLDKMELIKPEYVEEADIKPKKQMANRIKWISLAAGITLVIFAGTKLLSQNNPVQNTQIKSNTLAHDNVAKDSTVQNTTGNKPDLPKLTITENNIDGMGFEGYMAYDISELINANPWQEDIPLSTLPVYRRAVDVRSSYSIVTGADWDKIKEFILTTAERLGLDKNKVIVTDNFDQNELQWKNIEKSRKNDPSIPYGHLPTDSLIINADGVEIEADQFMTIGISFTPALSLPDNFNFDYHASYKDNVVAADYFKTKYKNLIGFDNPQVNITGGDYNIYAEQSFDIEFYNKSSDYTENIINYNFNRVIFCHNNENSLNFIRIFKPDLTKKLGNYPIISAVQARELLIKGNYSTSVPYKMPGEKYIRKVELVYRTSEMEEIYMPYYRFYTELPEEKPEHGLKTYGAYYVPAVEGSYLTNMPVYDGRFN